MSWRKIIGACYLDTFETPPPQKVIESLRVVTDNTSASRILNILVLLASELPGAILKCGPGRDSAIIPDTTQTFPHLSSFQADSSTWCNRPKLSQNVLDNRHQSLDRR